jgi:membrane protein
MEDVSRVRCAWTITKSVVAQFLAEKPFQLAAALSYFTLLSMVPLFLLLTGVAGLVYGEQAARAQLLQRVGTMVGQQQADVVRVLLSSAGNHHASVVSTIVGTAIAVVGATTVFVHLQTALNQVWDVQVAPDRSAIWRLLGSRLLALAIVFGMAFVLLVSMAASAALAGAHGYLSGLFPGAGTALRIVYALVSLAIVSGVIALLFKYVPDANIDWHDVLIGALATGILFTLGRYGLGTYLAHLRYSSAGSAGSLILLVVWVYYSALILFLGAQVTQVLATELGHGIRPKPHAARRWRRGFTNKRRPSP